MQEYKVPADFVQHIVERWVMGPRTLLEESIVVFWDQCYPMFVALWMATGNQGYLPEYVAGKMHGRLLPHTKHFKGAVAEMMEAQSMKGHEVDRNVWTRVEQCFILAAAMETNLMGRGRKVSFVKEVLELTLLHTTVPVSRVTSNGAIKQNLGPRAKNNQISVMDVLMRRWRNKIRATISKASIAVQQHFQRTYCDPRGAIEPHMYAMEPAVDTGESVWQNQASVVRRGSKRSGEFAADINEEQALFIAGNIYDDECYVDPLCNPFKAQLKQGCRQPGWPHSCVTSAEDVHKHSIISSPAGGPIDFTVHNPYTVSFFDTAIHFHRNINTVMMEQMWQPLEDGVQAIQRANIDATEMDREKFKVTMQTQAEKVVRRMLEAQCQGAVGTPQDRATDGCLKTEWNNERYVTHQQNIQKTAADEEDGRARVKKWVAVYWWQPGGLAVLDAFVAALVNVNKNKLESPHFKLMWPLEDSAKYARFVEIRTAFHKDHWSLLAPALTEYVRKVLETRMDERRQPSIGVSRRRTARPAVKQEQAEAQGHHCPNAGDNHGKNAALTKSAAMSDAEKAEVADAFKGFTMTNVNIYPTRIKKPRTDDDTVCRCEVDCGASCDNRRAQVECMVSTCPLGQACTNVGGMVSPQSLPKTIVARSEMNAGGGTVGLGLFVAQDVTQGQEIDAYTGDVRNTEQMEQVLRRRGTDAPRYDIELKPLPNTYRDGPLFIDAYSTGNKSRFINHSCDANCRFQKWQREGLPIIKVVAKQDIAAGTELTVDYHWGQEFACFCNTSKCRFKRELGKSGEAGSKTAGKRAADPAPVAPSRKRDRGKSMQWSLADSASQ